MSTSRPSMAPEGTSFFEQERKRLIDEISEGFGEATTQINTLNRGLDQAHLVGKDFNTVAQLWGQFTQAAQAKAAEPPADGAVPGTGTRHLGASVAGQPQSQ